MKNQNIEISGEEGGISFEDMVKTIATDEIEIVYIDPVEFSTVLPTLEVKPLRRGAAIRAARRLAAESE